MDGGGDPSRPRVVRRVVCGYRLGSLPGEWLQTWRRLDRGLCRRTAWNADLVTPASAAAGAFADLVRRLDEGTELTAEKVDPAEASGPKIVSYRGHTRLD